jgi:hypothetical protein
LNEVQEEFEFEQRQIIDDLARKRNADSTKVLKILKIKHFNALKIFHFYKALNELVPSNAKFSNC